MQNEMIKQDTLKEFKIIENLKQGNFHHSAMLINYFNP